MGYKQRPRAFDLDLEREWLNGETGVSPGPAYHSEMRWNDWRSGANNPKYRELIKSGLGATNALEARKQEFKILQAGMLQERVVNKSGGAYGQVATNTWLGIEPFLMYAFVSTNTMLEAENKAALKVRQKIRAAQQELSGLTFLGELRESVKMIRHPAQGLEHLLRKFIGDSNPKRWKEKNVRAGIRKASKTHYLRDLGEMWLEVNFGLVPLARDIQKIAESVLPSLDVDRIKRVRATADAYDPVAFETGVYNSVDNARVYQDNFTISRCDVNFEAGVRQRISMDGRPAVENLLSDRIFRLDDVIPTAWELLPWSFLVDYFSDIGNVLSANYLSMSDVAWSFRTRRVESVKTLVASYAIPLTPSWYNVESFKAAVYQSKGSWVERSTADVPYVTARFELPSKAYQFQNMIALLAIQKKTSF